MLEQLQKAHKISQNMLETAKNQQWEDFEQQQQQRSLLLNQAQLQAAEIDNENDSLKAEQLIQFIQILDEQIRPLCDQAQQATLKDIKTNQKGNKMKHAYQGN